MPGFDATTFSILSADPFQAADNVAGLGFEATPGVDTEVPALGELTDIACAFKPVNGQTTRQMLEQVGIIERALATPDDPETFNRLSEAKEVLERLIRGTKKRDWRRIYRALTLNGGVHARFRDDALPMTLRTLFRTGERESGFPPPEDPPPTQVQILIKGQPLTFKVDDKIQKLFASFIEQQTSKIENLVPAELSDMKPASSRDFASILLDANMDPQLTPHFRFIFRTAKTVGKSGQKLEEQFWMALFVKISKASPREILVRIHADETEKKEVSYVPFKIFMSAYIAFMQTFYSVPGETAVTYIFEPVDVTEEMKKRQK